MPFALAFALALALLLGGRQSSAASIAFDLSGLSSEQYRQIDGLALERKLTLRLVQEGFAVMAPGAGADVEIRAAMTSAGVEFRASSGGTARSVTISTADAPSAEWQLEVGHKISELARALALGHHRVEAPPPKNRSPARATAPLSNGIDSGWELGASAGALFRAGGSAPLVGLNAANSLGRYRLHLDTLATWSHGTEIEVWEAQGSAGVSVALNAGALGLDLGLAGGVVVQHFGTKNPWLNHRSGTIASPGAWLPLQLRWVARRAILSSRVALGLARSAEHTSQGATLWSRGALRLEALLGFAWAF